MEIIIKLNGKNFSIRKNRKIIKNKKVLISKWLSFNDKKNSQLFTLF